MYKYFDVREGTVGGEPESETARDKSTAKSTFLNLVQRVTEE